MKYPRVLKLAADARISPPTYSVLRILCLCLCSSEGFALHNTHVGPATTICRLKPTKVCIGSLGLKPFHVRAQNTISLQFEAARKKQKKDGAPLLMKATTLDFGSGLTRRCTISLSDGLHIQLSPKRTYEASPF